MKDVAIEVAIELESTFFIALRVDGARRFRDDFFGVEPSYVGVWMTTVEVGDNKPLAAS